MSKTLWIVKQIGAQFPVLVTVDEDEATRMVAELNDPNGGWLKHKIDEAWLENRIEHLVDWRAQIDDEISRLEVFLNEHRDTGTNRT